LGRPVADPSRWAVLYLGSAKATDLDTTDEVVAINRKGELEEHQRAILREIEGVVLLDGTWSQAKALWWRNAWMLKCQRVILGPAQPSRYGKLRREPRRDGLSTIEAAAMILSRLEGRPDIADALNASFALMLTRYREALDEQPSLAPKPRPKRDYRRRRRA
jgi:DTW domain-containing protein YfiP